MERFSPWSACIRLSAVFALSLLVSCGHGRKEPAPAAPKPPVVKKPVPRQGRVATIDAGTLLTLQQAGKVLLYDVRPAFVSKFGRLPGSVNWPRHAFDTELPQRRAEMDTAVAADRQIVLYCTDAECPDSRAIADRLAALSYSVAVLQGGFAGWKEAGLPLE